MRARNHKMAARARISLLLGTLWIIPAWVLAQSAGSSVTQRPDPEGVPTKVSLAVYLLDLVAVDDVRQEFTADLFFIARWRDARLALPEAAEAPSRTLPISQVWFPDIGLLNRRAASLYLPQIVRVDGEGAVVYSQRIYGQFSSRLDLVRFPADKQTFEVRLVSYRYGPEEVALEIDPARSGRLEQLSAAGWTIGDPVVEAEPLVVPSAGSMARAGAVYRVQAERDTTYYRLTFLVPLVLIALMAWSVFWIDPSLLPSQIGVSTASVFSLIAFRFSLQGSLPKISYLTTADWFVLSVTLLVFAALGEAVLTGRLAKIDRGDLARRIDSWARWIYLAVLVVVVLSFAL
ncbi:MAG: hypothetical protein OES47_13185 [Acidobacteriota bacterium]|nr:hypothetical protein [Acidobacteriota bacterium]